jgi:hypothetical protein
MMELETIGSLCSGLTGVRHYYTLDIEGTEMTQPLLCLTEVTGLKAHNFPAGA